jgi:hypothetical protein
MSSYSRYLKNKDVCCKIGPQGDRGERGVAGGTGSTGSTGSTGGTGTTGSTGATGAAGAPGLVVQYVYKSTGFTENLQNVVATASPFNVTSGYSCAANNGGYTESITPLSNLSRIKVQFKVKYQAANTKLRLGVVYTIDSGATYILLGQDTVGGPTIATGVFTDTYTFSFMHWPNTTNRITYTLFFQLDSPPASTAYTLGVLGDNPAGSNVIILEEYLASGTAVPVTTEHLGSSYGGTGATGAQGIQGTQGIQGIQGIQGPTGAQGAQGSAGAQGIQGLTGSKGATGAQGPQGSQGIQGVQGVQGVTGYTGAQGMQGAQGAQGSQGIQGIQGVTGYTGAQGIQGPQGSQGSQGIQGIQGVTGYTGAQGIQGAQGSQGSQGIQGIQGVTGYTGAQGIQGAQGAQGSPGIQGIQGVTGYTGAQGIQGPQGSVGEQGIQGIQGIQGPTGYTGAKGDRGDASLTGATGAQGIQGSAGAQGIQGVQGPTGYAGATGAQGAKGDRGDGAVGAMGPTGPAGSGGGTYANDTWLLTNLLGQPPPVVFGTPIYTSSVIYIPWIYPTKRKVGWGTEIWLPSITMCTIYITVGENPPYSVVNNSDTLTLINGSTTVLAITKNYTGIGFTTPIDNIGTSSVCKYGDAALSAALTSSSVNNITVFYSNASSFSPLSNPSSIQFGSFLPDITVTVTQPAIVGVRLGAAHNISILPGANQITYQWYSISGGITTTISGATDVEYTLVQSDIGKTFFVIVSYVTNDAVTKSITSNVTAAVVARTDNYAPGGVVFLNGLPLPGETLTASNNLSDFDGIATTISYLWYRNNVSTGVTGNTYIVSEAEVGLQIYVEASYTDNYGTKEYVQSTAKVIIRPNNPATGELIIMGTPVEGNYLTAANSIVDPDGIVAPYFLYAWYRNGASAVAFGPSYLLTQADVGLQIYVEASYTDSYGRKENVQSAPVTIIARVNNPPTGTVTITGTAQVGQTLTASSDIQDLDGMGTITYYWHHGYGNNAVASGPAYTLGPLDLGKIIVLGAAYTDGYGKLENIGSAPTAPVIARTNNPPTGTVTITGTPVQGETLTASDNIKDLDGIVPPIAYAWYRNNAPAFVNGPSYLLTQADVGFQIQVNAFYTDNYGAGEFVSSEKTPIIQDANDPATGAVTISGNTVEGQTLTANVSAIADVDGLGQFTYQWNRDGVAVSNATNPTYILGPLDVGKVITVIVSYIDGYGHAESKNASTAAITAHVNTPPTGSVTITGTAQIGQTLTASAANLVDIDGVGPITYKWYRSGDATSIATGTAYTPVRADFEKTITVTVSYTDDYGMPESKSSAATLAVIAPTNILPIGSVNIYGTAQVGETLTADASGLIDPDVIGAFTYQWNRNGVAIATANNDTYALIQADFEKTITVTASYTDGYKRLESKTSTATAPVIAPANTLPTGSVTITGTAVGSETLTANLVNLADADGLGAITYKWYSGVVLVQSTASNTYKLGPSDVGKTITVTASYTDGYKRAESVTSSATATVTAPTNTLPTGSATITGTAQVGLTLTASVVNLVDPDIVGAITYKWYRSGDATSIATGTTYALVRADFEKTITVTASYADGYGTQESLTSNATSAVIAPTNTLPVGSVTITGTAQVGRTLVSDVSTLADIDGLGTISYQWNRNGVAIALATNLAYTLVQADFEKTITVTASYTDGYKRPESKTSTATAQVIAPTNTLPTGSVTITGTAVGGETLTANLVNLADADGLGAITYKWYSGAVLVQSTASNTYKLGPSDVGKTIIVIASYTDGYKYVENVTSAATLAVTRPANTPATGDVTISGTAVGGNTLTAIVGTIADVDGLGTFAYQWNRAGVAVSNATNPTYILGPLDVGKAITVIVSFTDGYGYAESKTSVATSPVIAPTNILPTGSVTITGNTQVGQPLTATVNNLVDPDGIVSPITYQWYRNDVLIPNATNSTYELTLPDTGSQIKAIASYADGYGRTDSLTSSATTIPAIAAPAEPTALTSISLNVTSDNSYKDISSNIYRVLDRAPIGAAPLLKGPSVTTLPFNAPIHRLANRGTSGNSTLMTLSATLNGATGPSVLYAGFPATQPSAVTTNNITITPSDVADNYPGQPGYYLTSTNAISATGLSAGSSVNTLTATQTFANATVASASTNFYYDTPVTEVPACSINGLSIPSTKVSGLSIYAPPTGGATPTITVDASASNMGNYFYRSPLITYNYAINGVAMGPTGESGLGAVNPSDISGNMFKTGTLRFSSALAGTTSMTRIDISANAYNISGASPLTGLSFDVITDAASVTFVTDPSSIPILTASTAGAPTLIPGFRIWSAPITANASAPVATVCPDLSYNGILYYTMPYDNAGSLTSTDPSGCGTELLIRNGLFVTPLTTPSAYINYSTYAGNSGRDYSTITSSTKYRFATFCWKLPTPTSYANLTFTINSIFALTRVTSTGVIRASGTDMSVFYAFQNAGDPSSFPISNSTKYNSVWINANKGTNPSANGTTFANSYNTVSTRFGSLGQGSPNTTANAATGTATFKVFIPVTSPVPANVYLYLRIGMPLDKDYRFGSVNATLN